MNERARTPCGENFEQHRVRDAAVEDDRGLDPGVDRGDAGVDLGDHAAGDRLIGLERVDRRAVEVGEQRPVLVEDPRDVGEQEEALGAERPRDYSPDVTGKVATRLVRRGRTERKPFFIWWSPASPLALMGFDAGILTSPEAPEVPFRAGYVDWRPATPRTWMRDSVVWYSQWLTPQLGLARKQAHLAAFDYGNRDLSGRPGDGDGLTAAWLGSSLQISPDEQVAFLRRMLDGGLPVSAAAVANTGAILDHGTTAGGWHVRDKTGAAVPRRADVSLDRAHPIGWFIGWAEKAGERVIFARLVQQESADDIPPSWRARNGALDDLFGAGGLAE